MKHKYTDTTSTIQVIGCIYQDPSILDNENYYFAEEDFIEDIHNVIMGAIFDLHADGVKEITATAIEDYLEQHPKEYATYQTYKGNEFLQKLEENTTRSTFEFYYHRMKKMTLLRVYNEWCGMDLNWLYDPDEIMNIKKREAQQDWFDNTTEEEIEEIITDRFMKVGNTLIKDKVGQMIEAGDGVMDLLQRLKDFPEIGYPLYGDIFNSVLRGARLKKFYLRSAETGLGKAIPNDVLIPTPNGWRKVGDIKIGDYLFGQDGKQTQVLHTYPQPTQKDIWIITFADGRTAECCREHLWEYRYYGHRGYEYRVEDCETIYKRAQNLKNGFRNASGKGYRFHIRLNDPVEYPEKQFSVDPYVMGALLGDGSFRYNDRNKALTFSSKNDELPNMIAEIIGQPAKKIQTNNYSYTFGEAGSNIWVEDILANYPELWQTKSETKFIPKDYLVGSVEQRMALLQGLLDTDGHIDNKGRISYTTISPQLRDDVIELCRSLGMIATYGTDARTEKYTTGEAYYICIQAKKSVKPNMFRLSYKHKIAVDYAAVAKREEFKDHLAIVDIQPSIRQTDMTCFEVDNDDHLFLMNDYIVTHNTRSMIADVCSIGCGELYDKATGTWKKNGTKEPVLYVSTEQEFDEIQTMLLAFIANVNESHILYNEYTSGEWERVCKAAQVLKESNIHLKSLSDFNLSDIEDTIKYAVREYGVRYVFHDYIHSSMKILGEVAGKAKVKGLREDNVLFMISVRLKDLCNELGIFLLSATQLNNEFHYAKVFDQGLLQGAKAIANKVDVGMIMLYATEEDKEALKTLVEANGFEMPAIKISVYKNRRGQYNRIFIWCKEDRGVCRIDPLFCTNYDLSLRDDIIPLNIEVNNDGDND